MIKVMHFDHERYIGILEKNKNQFIVLPPFTKNTIKESTKKFRFPKNIGEYKEIETALSTIRSEFKISLLNKGFNLWTKLSHSSTSKLTPDKSRIKLIKTLEREFGQSRINDSDLNDLKTFHLIYGFADNHLRNIKRLVNLSDKDKAIKLNYWLNQPSGLWKDELDELLLYIKEELIPNKRFEEAHNSLTLIKMHFIEFTPEQESITDNLLDKTKEAITKNAIENGEPLAKPWQKYVKTQPTYTKHNHKKKNN